MQFYWFKFAKNVLDPISCFLHKYRMCESVYMLACVSAVSFSTIYEWVTVY